LSLQLLSLQTVNVDLVFSDKSLSQYL
jgi:hypothetical protein